VLGCPALCSDESFCFASRQNYRNQLDTACQHMQELSGKIIHKGSTS